MVGVVDHHHRVVRKQSIQIGLVERAAVGEPVDVVAVGDHPFAFHHRMARHVLAHHLLQAGDAGHRPGRRPLDVGPAHHLQGVGEVAMGINEARQQGAAGQIDVQGVRSRMGHYLILSTHSHDRSAADGDGLSPGL